MSDDPIDLLFRGMEKLGPGDDVQTLHVLRWLPRRQFRVIVDAGCGTGRQALAIARGLGVLIHAVDCHQPFLDQLTRRAQAADLDHCIQTHCLDMREIPRLFPVIDLLWSEGAAYNIGFANALATWAPALSPGGLAVVSELCWLTERAPAEVREFFRTCYSDMQSVQENRTLAERAGYKVLGAHVLPQSAWIDGYYDVLAPRARALLEHSQADVRDLAAETLREIEIFERSEGSYGYVFFILARAGQT